ncbi:hypothetical protein PV371_37255 [Streptomyces sp. TX20-6-3]|uniref:hypothetical protein n=1 Tax=Streptomyces sp. TX20-6-3 TaxID=3028705 RepID=UPI0029A9211E|nr:hypothetical protein [Streptomyces sp. TX20-6-3]MDX2565254.1 hypothetical protein [Streptomyces sp. TX20-6-3]
MDPGNAFTGEELFPGVQPWDVVYDALWVSHSEFWLAAGDGLGADVVTAIPEGDSVKGNGVAVGSPTLGSAGRVTAVLSVWESPAPDGQGTLLGTSRITSPTRELALINVEGREPGPVLVLQDEGEHEVKVWRRATTSTDDPEHFDIRVWPCPTRA